MGCTFTLAGNIRDCKDSIGGVREVYIAQRSDVSSITVASGTGIVTEIVMNGGKKFATYQLRRQKASFTNGTVSISSENGSVYFTNSVTFHIEKMNAARRLELIGLAKGEFCVIVKDNNHKCWLMGYENPVEMVEGGGETGTAYGDANQYTITLREESRVPAFEVHPDAIAGILDGNAGGNVPGLE